MRFVRGAIAVLLVIVCGMQAMWPCRCGLVCQTCRAKHCVHDAKYHECSHSHETTSVRDQGTAVEQTEVCSQLIHHQPPLAPKNRCMFCTGQENWLAERDSKWSLNDDLTALIDSTFGSYAWCVGHPLAVVQRLQPLCLRSDPRATLKQPPRMQV